MNMLPGYWGNLFKDLQRFWVIFCLFKNHNPAATVGNLREQVMMESLIY